MPFASHALKEAFYHPGGEQGHSCRTHTVGGDRQSAVPKFERFVDFDFAERKKRAEMSANGRSDKQKSDITIVVGSGAR